jgi:DNA end-binding protein Ku
MSRGSRAKGNQRGLCAVAARANWKGFLKIGEVVCPVALFTAASTSDRIAFHLINRATGHRLQRRFVDSGTGESVPKEEQVKGYEIAGDYVSLEAEEIASAIPQSDKILTVSAFVSCADIDALYLDKPYYLAPYYSAPSADGEATVFALIREGMREKNVAALAQAVLFRRVHNLLIRSCGEGLVATTLHYDYEVRSAVEAFRDVPAAKIEGEMIDLAKHIIETKRGHFDPTKFYDRYEAALADLVKAKIAGKAIPPRKEPPRRIGDLMAALRESAGLAKEARGVVKKEKARASRRPKEERPRPARRKAG